MNDEQNSDHSLTLVDVLMGRHQHQAAIPITADQRLYGNYRMDEPSRHAEVSTAGRQRHRPEFDDPENPVAQTLKQRGY